MLRLSKSPHPLPGGYDLLEYLSQFLFKNFQLNVDIDSHIAGRFPLWYIALAP